MPNYRRVRVPGGTYFFTVNLLERRRRLLVERVDDLRASFRAAQAARPFEMLAIVVLPDHLHCVWRLPTDDADNANRWAQIKAGFSRRLPQEEWRSERRIACRERGIPVAVSMAGGYGRDIDITVGVHLRTLQCAFESHQHYQPAKVA